MKIALRAQGVYKKTTLMAAAFILAVSTLTAAVPFILSQKADALTTYTTAALTTGELSNWSPDRQTPSGGYGSLSFAGRTNVLEMNVDTAHSNATAFYRTEGLQRPLASDTSSIKADLYVEADWATKDVRAGLWGVGHDGVSVGNDGITAYPIVEFVSGDVPNNGGYTGWRIWDSVDPGAWTNLPGVAYNTNGWNTLAISLNRSTDKFEYFINGAFVGTDEGNGSVKIWKSILNSYNNANNDVSYNYAARWSNFAYGVTAPDHVYLDDDYTSASAGGHVWGYDAFSVLQDALDAVATNGTVHIADGVYTGTANITKDGTKLIGVTNSRDTVKIMPTASSGQAGLFVNGVNNVTIKNLGVYGANFGANGGLIKLNDGNNARIENVVVKNSNATGININGYSNVVVTGVYVADSAKDGISVVAQQEATSTVSKNITIQNTAISQRSAASWSAIAFYTKSSSGILNSIEGVVISNVSTQYGQRGIYVEGVGGTVTNPGSNKLILNNVTVGQNTNEYINNEQSADIDARSLKVDIGGGIVVPVSVMDQAQFDNVLGKIKDKTHKNPTSADYGYVYLATMDAPVITNSPVYVNSSVPYGYATWTHSGIGVKNFEYREYLSMAEADADVDGNTYSYWTQTKSASERQQSVGASWTGNKTLYYRVVAIDEAGNRSAPSALGTVIVDRVAPEAPTDLLWTTSGGKALVSGDATNEEAGVASWSASNSGDVSHYIYKYWNDRSGSYSETSPWLNPSNIFGLNLPGVFNQGEGTHYFSIAAVDTAGNQSPWSAPFVVTYDTTAPVASFSALSYLFTGVPSISGLVDDPTATLKLIVDGGTPIDVTDVSGTGWAYTFLAALADGTYNLELVAKDAAGNSSYATATLVATTPEVTPDTTTPVQGNVTVTPTTPGAPTPAAQAVLGVSTTNNDNETSSADGAAVEGASSEKIVAQAADTDAAADANDGTIWGLAWYWWLLIVAALAAIVWWIAAALRRRSTES